MNPVLASAVLTLAVGTYALQQLDPPQSSEPHWVLSACTDISGDRKAVQRFLIADRRSEPPLSRIVEVPNTKGVTVWTCRLADAAPPPYDP